MSSRLIVKHAAGSAHLASAQRFASSPASVRGSLRSYSSTPFNSGTKSKSSRTRNVLIGGAAAAVLVAGYQATKGSIFSEGKFQPIPEDTRVSGIYAGTNSVLNIDKFSLMPAATPALGAAHPRPNAGSIESFLCSLAPPYRRKGSSRQQLPAPDGLGRRIFRPLPNRGHRLFWLWHCSCSSGND